MSEPFRVNILTIFPEMFESFFASSILGRAREQGLIDIRVTDIRPYTDSEGNVYTLGFGLQYE